MGLELEQGGDDAGFEGEFFQGIDLPAGQGFVDEGAVTVDVEGGLHGGFLVWVLEKRVVIPLGGGLALFQYGQGFCHFSGAADGDADVVGEAEGVLLAAGDDAGGAEGGEGARAVVAVDEQEVGTAGFDVLDGGQGAQGSGEVFPLGEGGGDACVHGSKAVCLQGLGGEVGHRAGQRGWRG